MVSAVKDEVVPRNDILGVLRCEVSLVGMVRDGWVESIVVSLEALSNL